MTPNLKKAHAAPRCQFTRLNDQPCTQPALTGSPFCRFHDLIVEPPADSRIIPFVEDATTLQTALMQVIRSLQLGRLDRRTAGTILYALQIAASNLKYLAAETGRPYPNLSAKPTRKQDEDDDDIPGPSLAEILLDRLRQLEEDPSLLDEPQEPRSESVKRSAAAPQSTLDNRQSAMPSGASNAGVSPATPRSPASSAVKPGVIDKLEACSQSTLDNRKSKMSSRASNAGVSPATPIPDAASIVQPSCPSCEPVPPCSSVPSVVNSIILDKLQACAQSPLVNRRTKMPFGPVTESRSPKPLHLRQ